MNLGQYTAEDFKKRADPTGRGRKYADVVIPSLTPEEEQGNNMALFLGLAVAGIGAYFLLR